MEYLPAATTPRNPHAERTTFSPATESLFTSGPTRTLRAILKGDTRMLLIILVVLLLLFGFGGYRMGPGIGYYGGGGLSLVILIVIILLLTRVI
jgi:hypothetical protein